MSLRWRLKAAAASPRWLIGSRDRTGTVASSILRSTLSSSRRTSAARPTEAPPATAPPEPPLDASSLASLLRKNKIDPEKVLSSLTAEQIDEYLHDWSFQARPEQRPQPTMPDGPQMGEPWQNWLYLAGRGAGKTRSGAEWIRQSVKDGARYIGIIAPTASDIRKVMIEGSSGILATAWEKDEDCYGCHMGKPDYEPSKSHRLTWKNGAVAHAFTAEEPDRLRGPQHEKLWCDEVAAWHYAQDTWDMAMFGLRLGSNPQVMISTTPRPIPIIRELMRSPNTLLTRSSSFQNRANLAPSFFDRIVAKYRDTRIGRQELNAELLEEMEGALWNRETIEKCALGLRFVPHLNRIVVAVDPAITENPTSNLTGIVAAGIGADGAGYVLSDRSGRYSPDAWAKEAVRLYEELHADRIVAEGNQGGNMVRHTIETVSKNVPITIVHASRSKQARAEPVAALYEQNRIFHVQPFPELEDQLCTWEPLSGDPSPDRLDALVWAITALMLGSVETIPFVAPIMIGSPRMIPGQ
jgi:phage terminase large subunit-like protein